MKWVNGHPVPERAGSTPASYGKPAWSCTESRLLLIEVVLPVKVDRADPRLERLRLADLNMLVVTGGRERSEIEWEALLTSTGFELRRVVTAQDASIVEAVPRA